MRCYRMVNNGVVLIRHAAGISNGGNTDERHILILNIPDVLELIRGPVYRTQLEVLHITLQPRAVGAVIRCIHIWNQGHKPVETKRRVRRRGLREQRAARNIDSSLTGLSSIREGRTHPINCAGSSDLDKDSNCCGSGNRCNRIGCGNTDRKLCIIMVNQIGLAGSRAAGTPPGQKPLAPDHRLPASAILIPQAHVKMMIQLLMWPHQS